MLDLEFYGPDHAWFKSPNLLDYKLLKIGVINWWFLSKEQACIESILKFVDRKDICFFVSEEIFDRFASIGLDLDHLFAELNKRKVYYICMSEHNNLVVKPDLAKSFYSPWFFKIPLYIPDDLEDCIDYKEKKYDFNMLLGSEKSYRTIVYKILKDNSKVYSTYYGHDKFKNLSDQTLDKEGFDQLSIQDVKTDKLNTMIILNKGNSSYPLSQIVPSNIYNNTHFDFVCETYIKEGHFFLTEKIAKPLATGRFFCLYASSDSKKYLQRHGFSFDTYYDNYDSISDPLCRLDAVIEDIETITSNETLVKHIYSTSAEERINNMYIYKKNVERFYDELENWLNNVLENA